MRTEDVRKAFLEYYKEKGHVVVPSASLLPQNDPTTLFTGSGMQPILPYLLGEPHPKGRRIADSQKAFRADDIEEVGDNRHTTFFEMLGNWSFGDYFKEEQLTTLFSFLTKELNLDPTKLYVTVFAGAPEFSIPKDTESITLWQELFKTVGIDAPLREIGTEENGYKIGMGDARIFAYDSKKNWWSRAGKPDAMPAGEPGGPDSEVFYDFGTPHDPAFGEQCHPNCDCGRFMEICNSVFMEYLKKADGGFEALPQRNVDFGGGLERLTAATIGTSDVFKIDALFSIIEHVEKLSNKKYGVDTATTRSFRIIADHMRAAVFLMSDGAVPSNSDQGYYSRRLLRRAIINMDALGMPHGTLASLVEKIVDNYAASYPELSTKQAELIALVREEEKKFRVTLELGLKQFEKLAHTEITGRDAFVLFSTFGFPIEITQELAAERGLTVDVQGYLEEMSSHQVVSRKGAEQKFKGGLADHSEKSVAYHTATHLLHRALKEVLGDSVVQKGSNITPERLRFDFSFERKMTDEEKQRVEGLVNEKIAEQLPVTYRDLPLAEAEKLGAIGLFGEKYGDVVRVYQIGDFSLEFCGGPHVVNTSVLGHFRLVKEEAVAAGIRRIKAVLE